MTVAELIEKLSKYLPETIVYVNGDDYGPPLPLEDVTNYGDDVVLW